MSEKNIYEIGEVKWAKYDDIVKAVIGKLKDKENDEHTFQLEVGPDSVPVEGELLQFVKEKSRKKMNIDIVKAEKI